MTEGPPAAVPPTRPSAPRPAIDRGDAARGQVAGDAAAAVSSTSGTAANVSGSSGLHAEQHRGHRLRQQRRRAQPGDDAGGNQRQSERTNIRFTSPCCAPEGQADPDLPRPLRHRVGDHAVDADDAEQSAMPPAIASITSVNDVRAIERS